MGSWTGGRRRLKKEKIPIQQTAVISNPAFLLKQDKGGNRTKEYSELTLQAVAKRWEKVLIFSYVPSEANIDPENTRDNKKLVKFLDSLSINNVELILTVKGTTPVITEQWKSCLIRHGARIKNPKNLREISYLTLNKYMDAPHIIWIKQDDHKKIGIEVDKPLNFEELQEKRKRVSEW